VSLWPWPRLLTLKLVHVSWSTLLPILVIPRVFVVDLWAIGRGRASVGAARRHRYQSIGQQQPLLLRRRNRKKMTNNCFFGDTSLDLESDFRKLGSIAMLRSLWCKLIRKWARNTPNNNNQRYAVSSHSKDIPQDVCQH